MPSWPDRAEQGRADAALLRCEQELRAARDDARAAAEMLRRAERRLEAAEESFRMAARRLDRVA